jgi:ribonuclease HI
VDHNQHILFFYGASKGNLGMIGVGGILFDPRGHVESDYSLGLMITIKNEAKTLVVFQGLQILKPTRG